MRTVYLVLAVLVAICVFIRSERFIYLSLDRVNVKTRVEVFGVVVNETYAIKKLDVDEKWVLAAFSSKGLLVKEYRDSEAGCLLADVYLFIHLNPTQQNVEGFQSCKYVELMHKSDYAGALKVLKSFLYKQVGEYNNQTERQPVQHP